MVVLAPPPTFSNVALVRVAETPTYGIQISVGQQVDPAAIDDPIDYALADATFAAAERLDDPPSSPLPRSPFDL